MDVRFRTYSARELRRPTGTASQDSGDDVPFVEIIGSLSPEAGDDASSDQNRQSGQRQRALAEQGEESRRNAHRAVAAQLLHLQRALDEGRNGPRADQPETLRDDPESPLGKAIDFTA